MKLYSCRGVLKAGALLACLGGAGLAHAQTSATLSVTGTITPPSCTVNLDNGGKVDMGTISFNALNAGGTKLPAASIGVQISCEGETRVGLQVMDNRASSKIPKSSVDSSAWASTSTSVDDDYIYGLGMADDGNGGSVKIGGYMFGFQAGEVTADGVAKSDVIYSLDQSSWSYDVTLQAYFSPKETYSFVSGSANTGNNKPTPVTTVAGSLSVTATIAKANTLPTTEDIQFDGNATLTLVYL